MIPSMWRIKGLELLGFKSFRDRTVLAFPFGITAIVGPNGCGKSNILDAIRWVLGEQSPKHLRGKEMGDVVFVGSEGSGPLGMAEVSLLLECDEPGSVTSGVESRPVWADSWGEVMVTRRYFRSGESEYFINRVPCRLRDIVEFFLGTGVGTKAYAIIEQGQVDQLVSAKPEEIRLWVEEAAGTSLYRSRKLAAERKMERTRENLLRITDILREVERQMAAIRRQAKKAEQYRRYREEVRAVEIGLAARSYRHLAEELRSLEEQRESVLTQGRSVRQAIASTEREKETKGEERGALESRARNVQERVSVLVAECGEGERRRHTSMQHQEERRQRHTALCQEEEQLCQKAETVATEISTVKQRQAEFLQLASCNDSQRQQAEESLRGCQKELTILEKDLDAEKSRAVDLLTRETHMTSDLLHLQREAEEATRRLKRFQEERSRDRARLEEGERARLVRAREIQDLHQQLEGLHRERAKENEALRDVLRVMGEQESHCVALKTKEGEIRARIEALQEVDDNHRGSPAALRTLLTRSVPGIFGVVAEVFDVPTTYEKAFAAVLGERLHYFIVAGPEEGIAAIEFLHQHGGARQSFIPVAPVSPSAPLDPPAEEGNDGAASLLSVVQVDQQYKKVAECLLGGTLLVQDLSAARKIWQRDGHRRTLVTLSGDVLDSSGVISGGGKMPEERFLQRRRDRKKLGRELAEVEEELQDISSQRQILAARRDQLEKEMAGLNERERNFLLLSEEAQEHLQRLEVDRRHLAEKIDGMAAAIQEVEREVREREKAAETLHSELAEIQRERESKEENCAAIRQKMTGRAEEAELLRTEVANLAVKAIEHQERHKGADATLGKLEEQHADIRQRLHHCQREIRQHEEIMTELQQQLAEVNEELTEKEKEREQSAQEATALQMMGGQLSEEIRQLEIRLRDVREREEHLREERGKLEVAVAEKSLTLRHLQESMADKYGLSLEELASHEEEELEPEEGHRRLVYLKEKIARLGDVNVTAAEELAQLDERHRFLHTQQEDLSQSLADLQRTIDRLNRESRIRFRDTLERVNDKFQEVFPKLFPGGKAGLVLRDEDNVWESGVGIVIHLPGKKLQSLHQMSGGEKALTALGLSLALFLTRPSPFCFLDEVDAPLDDANIVRFNQHLREMSRAAQFILITHNKRTMEVADTLYGVTMEESGVSKIISVRTSSHPFSSRA